MKDYRDDARAWQKLGRLESLDTIAKRDDGNRSSMDRVKIGFQRQRLTLGCGLNGHYDGATGMPSEPRQHFTFGSGEAVDEGLSFQRKYATRQVFASSLLFWQVAVAERYLGLPCCLLRLLGFSRCDK